LRAPSGIGGRIVTWSAFGIIFVMPSIIFTALRQCRGLRPR
jgi:hypothetical protein